MLRLFGLSSFVAIGIGLAHGALAADLSTTPVAPGPATHLVYGRLVTTDSSITTDGTLFGFSGSSQTYPGADNDTPFNGGFGGGQVGYNWQAGALVFGGVADAQLSGITRSDTIPGAVGGDPRVDTRADLQWFSTVRGRVGFAMDRVHIYGTAGLAVGGTKGTITVTSSGGTGTPYSASDSSTQVGYVVGAGVEAALGRHWVVGAEYLYMNLGSHRYNFAFSDSGSSTATSKEAISDNLFRGTLSYKF